MKMFVRTISLLILLVVFSAVFLTGCHTVPETGRQAFVLIPETMEFEMGLSAYSQILAEKPASTNPTYNNRVQRIGQRIATVADKPNYQWEFTVFDAPDEVNAWCLPGGKIGVYSGMFKVTQNEAQLATVMAHEIGHAVAKHGAERMSQGLLLAVGAEVIAATMKDETAEDQKRIEGMKAAYGIGSALFVMLPFSRKQEYEADEIGLMYMAKAGYDPREAIKLWEGFIRYKEEKGGSGLPEYLSTHPSDEKRIARMKELMPRAMNYYYEATGQTPTESTFTHGANEDIPKATIQRGTGTSGRSGRTTFKGIPLDDDR